MKQYSIYFLALFLLLACGDDEDQPEPDQQTDYVEQFRECADMPLNDDRLIAEALPGTWELVHLYYGWTGEPDTLPEMTIEFDQSLNMIYTSPEGTWQKQMTLDTSRLVALDGEYIPVIQEINVFCSDIMGFDHTPYDGNRYIFVKQ